MTMTHQDELDAIKQQIAEERLSDNDHLYDSWSLLPEHMTGTDFRAFCERNPELWEKLIWTEAQTSFVTRLAEDRYAEDCAERKFRKGYMG